ncbi:MAG: hypothetical protein K940chlam7_01129 [Chlamydiae bacterium]|nr:hypothetical protein [Chlamydiota bacterium]
MSSAVYSPHEFYLQTKTLEQQAYDSALGRVKQVVQNETDIKVQRVSRKICNEAYNTFSKNIKTTFSLEVYKDLINLMLISREKLFFIKLKEQVLTILRNANEERMATIIGESQYTYGAGNPNNRQVIFARTEEGTNKIIVAVRARTPGGWKEISRLNGDQINVEMMSRSDKVRVLLEERGEGGGGHPSRIPDKKLSKLDSSQQEAILKALEPDGKWRVEITNNYDADSKFEKIVQLTLFNPS